MVLQAIHEDIKFFGLPRFHFIVSEPESLVNFSGIYATSSLEGSPAYTEQYASGVYRINCLVTGVNDVYVSSLDLLVAAISGPGHTGMSA